MKPTLAAAIRTYSEKNGLVLSVAFIFYETVSTKQKKGLSGGKAEIVLTGLVLTPQLSIIATEKNHESPAILSTKLGDIRVQDYEKSEMYKLMPDSGIELSGLRTDLIDRGSLFIGLGPEPAAQNFRAALKDAVTKV